MSKQKSETPRKRQCQIYAHSFRYLTGALFVLRETLPSWRERLERETVERECVLAALDVIHIDKLRLQTCKD